MDKLQLAPPVENGVDVMSTIQHDLIALGEADVRQAVYPMVDVYRYLLWLAAKMRLELGYADDPYKAVANDMEAAAFAGVNKHGSRLRTHNGRNSIADGYADLLGVIKHLGKARLEGKLL